jgi:hypothetical protein
MDQHKPSKHEMRKQKKKVQKRKRSLSSGVTFTEKKKPVAPDHDDRESGSEDDFGDADASHALGADSKLVPTAGTKSKEALVKDDSHQDDGSVSRPIIPFLEGKETRPPAEVLAWMIAPMSLQQFFESVVIVR